MEGDVRFVFSEEQHALREAVRRFLRQHSSEQDVRRLMETANGYDGAVWKQMAGQLGLQSLTIPEKFGGAGFTYTDLMIVFEEMGAALLCAPFFSTVALAANVVLFSEDTAAQEELLPSIAGGDTIATLAYLEDEGSWSPSDIAMPASLRDGRWTLRGTKSFVLDGLTASLILVVARSDDGLGLFAVDAGAAGLTRTPLTTLDRTRKQARLEFADTPARRIGAPGSAERGLARTLDLAAVLLAAEQVGAAQRCLDLSVEYANTRFQFGRAIGSFQAIKHRCADLRMQIEAARSIAYYAGWAAAEGSSELPVVASMAKAYCSDTFMAAAAEMIQIHGGIGFTWEHPAHLYFRRAKSAELIFGDPAYHREQLAQRLAI
jgi:alkylation response protein AidB-like acyl-CoA dehydrogenase